MMLKFIKRYIKFLVIVISLAHSSNTYAAANVFEWMTKSILGLGGFFTSCIEVPPYGNFRTGSQILNLASAGQWISTGVEVKKDKMIKFDWGANGVTTRPRKHLVLYRIDPRFERSQIFIQTYDYNLKKYVSDFHKFKNGQLVKYQTDPNATNASAFTQKINDYIEYFNFIGRDKIAVNAGDIVNITLIDSADFFSPKEGQSDFTSDLGYSTDLSFRPLTIAYSDTQRIPDNKIIYSNKNVWCDFASTAQYFQLAKCDASGYYNTGDFKYAILVGMDICPFSDKISSVLECPEGVSDMNQSPLCFYTKGRGMLFSVNGKTVKFSSTSLIDSSTTNKYFFYYKSPSSGTLDITTDWQMDNMFNGFTRLMKDWKRFNSDNDLATFVSNNTNSLYAKFLHFGRYFMSIEIGNGDTEVSFAEQDSIKVEYVISKNAPAAGFSGTEVPKNYKVDAESDGFIWLRVINPLSQIQGAITVKYSAYTGTTIFSDIVEDKLVKPLTDKFHLLSQTVYNKLITNATAIGIVRVLLTLYIAFYALWFLAGATQMTINDIIIRIAKIIIVTTLFSKTSWNFFNEYLFGLFTDGMGYFIGQVVNASSSAKGMFAFIDPIFDRYTNPTLWGLLLIQLLQIHNGLAFFAIMTIYSMLTFFRGILEIVIGYCLAYIGLVVMISLAPLFITFILFERTRSMFDNWISTLFNYMIQPTILLIFFLLIDQLIGRQITDVVTRACWGELIPLDIAIDLRHIGIPLDFSFKLPFLPYIPFFVTDISDVGDINDVFQLRGTFLFLITSTLLLYCYCTMARGLVDYVSTISSMLTNVLPARQEGRFQKSASATASIISDIGGLLSPVKSAGMVFKDKVIDQNYAARGSNLRQRKEDVDTHVGKVFKSRYDGPQDDNNSQARGGNNDSE